MAARFIEDRHEVKLKRRIADIRPWTEKAAESLSERFTFSVAVVPLLILAVAVPLSAFLALPLVMTLILTHKSARPLLPMRYPAFNPEVDPATKKPGNGIMFFGNQDSSSVYEKFKEIWGSDDDLRKHMLILGSTGSGKSETLKALFFNALCWSSGFFIADGKADNKLPTDVFTMVRSVGMDDNLLILNFLLAGKTPEQVRRSRRRRTNKLNPFTSADADTIIQMGANMLPKVEGEGKNWQEKALNLWRAQVMALCYKRDTMGFELSVSTLVDYMSLAKIEELYIEGFDEAKRNGEWSYGFVSIKTYLDSGCPAYKVDKLLAKHNRDGGASGAAGGPAAFGAQARGGKAGSNEQDSMTYEQHAYRTSQLMPVLNLLDKTYGHVFKDKYPEIDMVDVTLNNRIMTMLIPSLEKSAQEAENLGKLAIACLRVMMSRNLGGGVEGTRMELLESKATNAPHPYLVALDELGYYFSDGIAVIFAQARSLGFSMIPAAQDLEKLTEGNRAAEAGAMMANSVTKVFLRIDDAKKTYEFVQGTIQKAMVAVYKNFEITGMGWRRKTEVDLMEIERVGMKDLQAMEPGQGLINALGKTTRFRSYYMDGDLKKHRAENFYVLRFLQVRPPSDTETDAFSETPNNLQNDPKVKGERLRSILAYESDHTPVGVAPCEVIEAIQEAAQKMPAHIPGDIRAIALYEAARQALRARAERVAREGALLGTSAAGGEATQPDRTRAALPPRSGGAAAGPRAAQSFDVDELLDEVPAALRQAKSLKQRAPADFTDDDAVPRGSAQSLDPRSQDQTDDIDLEALLSPKLPFERKALEELRAGDLGEAIAPFVGEHLIDPVDSFLSGVRFFNMPKIVEPSEDQTYSDAVAELLGASGPSRPPPVVGQRLLDAPASASSPLPAPAPPPSMGAGAAEGDWINEGIDSFSRAARIAPHSERSAVGFNAATMHTLGEIESILGNAHPERAVVRLEGIMSTQLTPALRPEVAADDDTVAQLLGEFDSLGANAGAGTGNAE